MPGEHPTITFHPALRSVLARSMSTLLWCGGLAVVLVIARRVMGPTLGGLVREGSWGVPFAALAMVAVFRVVKEVFVRSSRTYTIGPRLVTSTFGIVHRTRVEVPLANIRQAVLDRSFSERVFGLGTICVTTAGSQTIDLAWVAVSRAEERLAMIRAATEPGVPTTPMVIGLAGGIGSGKSAVAKVLAGMNYLVIDSDAEAKAALDRPEVLGQLVRWWGKDVATTEGRADRKAIAAIVFADPAQRARLEGLVHPLVKAGRAELVARAAAQGRPGVVIDAPLLFEAGSDAECDAVIFVDAPRAARLARVQATRGWDEAELARREIAQIPLQEKQRRSDTTVVNDGPPETLAERVGAALAFIASKPSRRLNPQGKLSNP